MSSVIVEARPKAPDAGAPLDAPVVSVEGLRWAYGDRRVLESLDLSVAPGEIVGLLGPNGSGKSTALSLIAGLTGPAEGIIRVGAHPVRHRVAVSRRRLLSEMGMVFQSPALDLRLTATHNLRLAARLHGLTGDRIDHRVHELLAAARLRDRADEPVSQLSGGMRRRLDIARALLHGPRLLLLDEPTSGLDESAFHATWDQLQAMGVGSRVSVLVATHRADEAERCHRVAILDGGRALVIDSPQSLRERLSAELVILTPAEGSAEALAGEVAVRLSLEPRVTGEEVIVECERGHELIPRIVEAFEPQTLESVSLRRPSMADVFLKITGLSLGEDLPAEHATEARPPTPPPPAGGTVVALAGNTDSFAASAGRPSVPATEWGTASAMWLRDMLHLVRERSRWLGVVLQPLLFWVIIGTGLRSSFQIEGLEDVDYLAYFFPGILVMIVLFTSIFGTISLIEDRLSGFLQGVLTSPGSRTSMVVGKIAGVTSLAMVQSAIFVAIAPFAGYPLAGVDWPLLLTVLLLGGAGLSAVGFAMAWLLPSSQAYHGVMSVLLLPLWVLSGAMFPARGGWIEPIALANPMTYAVSGARAALGGETSELLGPSAPTSVIVLAVFCVVAIAVAVWCARHLVTGRARRA